MDRLKSEDFKQRESAQVELQKWGVAGGETAMREIQRQSSRVQDPEQKERCLAALRAILRERFLKEGEGFIGVRMQDDQVILPNDPNPHFVIRVIDALPGYAAQLAGVRANDVIVSVNGKDWREPMASHPLIEQIRQMKPSTKITLGIFRGGKLIDVVVVLGRRPVLANNPMQGNSAEEFREAEQKAMDIYFNRWLAIGEKAK